MNYWLMKSEPSTWSWNDQLAKGEDGEGWDGVRNHQASNNMKAMEIGDLAFFYHPVIICGQGLGLFIYLRNLYFIRRDSGKAEASSQE